MRFRRNMLIAGMVLFGAHTSAAQDMQVRGVVRSLAEATISMEYTARITRIGFLEGEAFSKGDVLIAFDCARYQAEVAAARAQQQAAGLVYTNNKKLLARGAIGANEVKVSEAEFQKAKSEAIALQARTGSCAFEAPFDGRVVQRMAQEHESPAANQPLIRIVDTTRIEVEVIVPSKWLKWLEPGASFDFKVDETGETVKAQVARLGATVDPVSQTLRAFATLPEDSQSVLPGMSGTALFNSSGS